MIRIPENRDELLRRRRRKRWLRRALVIICCLAAFFLGKMVGLAQKGQDAVSRREPDVPAQSAPEAVTADAAMAPDAVQATDAAFGRKAEGCLILVNKDNPLPEDYAPELVTLQNGRRQSAKEAYPHLCDMLRAGIKEGLTFTVCSAYRSVERQTELFEEDVRALMAEGLSYERAYEKTAEETMPPGCSEHSTGLAFDIVAFDYQVLDEKQAHTAENKWLRQHCAEYGFILRYPKGKENETGIRYESWHFRYVGVEAAGEIMERGITLEEYLEEDLYPKS